MSYSVTPGSGRSDYGGSSRAQPNFVVRLVRQYGFKAVLALVVAAAFAFAPLTMLYWFGSGRLQAAITIAPGQRVVVKPHRRLEDQEREEPGETALLQVVCEVPHFETRQPLLRDDDPRRRALQLPDSIYTRRELVYLRRAGDPRIPFGCLGAPPVSAWLPAGEYEILVVHEAPPFDPLGARRAPHYPFVSVFASCTLESRRKSVVQIPLAHYDWGDSPPIRLLGEDGAPVERASPEDLALFYAGCADALAIPTPAGYVLTFGEPRVAHTDDHRECALILHALDVVPREWTRDQIAHLRNWLPDEAGPARARLSQLVERLLWREFFQGWYCYAAAGIAGLVFTRWGALAILEPWRRGSSFRESLGLLVQIFLFAAGAWFLWVILTDSSGCHGPVPFRFR